MKKLLFADCGLISWATTEIQSVDITERNCLWDISFCIFTEDSNRLKSDAKERDWRHRKQSIAIWKFRKLEERLFGKWRFPPRYLSKPFIEAYIYKYTLHVYVSVLKILLTLFPLTAIVFCFHIPQRCYLSIRKRKQNTLFKLTLCSLFSYFLS